MWSANVNGFVPFIAQLHSHDSAIIQSKGLSLRIPTSKYLFLGHENIVESFSDFGKYKLNKYKLTAEWVGKVELEIDGIGMKHIYF